MAQDQNNLIWLDMEMTGLDPDKDRIIEVAIVVTDSQLNALAEAPVPGRAPVRRSACGNG